jgi:putative spermidine/putrescine transport system permease protein
VGEALEQDHRRLKRPRAIRRRDAVMAGLAAPAVVFTIVFFVVPLLQLLGNSVLGYSQGEIVHRATFANYAALFGDPFYLGIIGRTVLVAVATTACCILLGYPVALGIVRADKRWRPLLVTLVLMPLLIGGVVRSYGWILILDERGLVNSTLMAAGLTDQPLQMLANFGGVVVTMVEVLLPFFVLPLMGALSGIDPALENAALSMGASRWQTFTRVVLPLSLAGVIAGGSIVFSLALNIFVVPQIIGGPSYLVLSTLAYQQVGTVGNIPFGSAVAALMLALTLLILIAVNRALVARYRHAAV